MARKAGLVLLIGLYCGVLAAGVPLEGGDSAIGTNEGGATATAPTTDAEAAPVGGPVPEGAFSNDAGGPMGPEAQNSAAATLSSFQRSAIVGVLGLGAIYASSFC